MLAHNLKNVIVLVDKDRVKSGLLAIDKWKVDTLLLDDGLQYLHLKHRLDIVLIDRQAPFGNEFLLPRGTLREPRRNLRRASYIFITKCTGESNAALIERIRRYNRTAEIIECTHKPLYLQNMLTGETLPLERLRDTFIGSICGIAAPESFEDGLRKLGARVDLAKRYIDHHRYTEGELQTFMNRCLRRDLEMIVTTEKDAVRMPRLPIRRCRFIFCGWRSKLLADRRRGSIASAEFAGHNQCFRRKDSLPSKMSLQQRICRGARSNRKGKVNE